jgi:hypothetical protein
VSVEHTVSLQTVVDKAIREGAEDLLGQSGHHARRHFQGRAPLRPTITASRLSSTILQRPQLLVNSSAPFARHGEQPAGRRPAVVHGQCHSRSAAEEARP